MNEQAADWRGSPIGAALCGSGSTPDCRPVLDPAVGSRFLVTVDTEEEFDWSAPFASANRSVTHVAGMERFQDFCDDHGVRPVYLVDHPIVMDDCASDRLAGFCREGRADVGMHLHPWVTPPLREEICNRNSYPGNLDPELERAKIATMKQAIGERIGVDAAIYRAGRYGIGSCTHLWLEEQGICFDSSVRPHFDYRGQEGPNFLGAASLPAWIVPDRLAELPLTTMFSGYLRGLGPALQPLASRFSLMSAALAKTGLVERIPLTPEGISEEDALAAVDVAVGQRLPLIVLSFHSPTLVPGNTGYVRDDADLEAFYSWWSAVFRRFSSHAVRPVTLDALLSEAFPDR